MEQADMRDNEIAVLPYFHIGTQKTDSRKCGDRNLRKQKGTDPHFQVSPLLNA